MLIINDLGIVSSPGFAEIDQAIFRALQNSPYQIELYHESLQLTLFPDEASQDAFRQSLIHRYSERKPDVIIAAGTASLKLIAESHYNFIRETPVVFCTVLGEIPDELKSGLHVTGVLARLQPEETLKTAVHLLPGTKHVVVVGGMGKFDEQWERVAKLALQKYESKFDFTYLTSLTMPVLLERLNHLPSNTIVFHTAFTQDAAGERFIDSAQSVPLVISAANAPVFVMDDVDLRAGTIGGALVNWPDDARVAGDIAVRILNGERPEDIPIVMSRNVYMFDWRALKRWGLKESDLPSGSIVLNRQPTFWEVYKRYIIITLFVLLAQTVAIFALLWQRAKRRKTEKELAESEEKFSKAFQRSPLSFTLASLVNYRFLEVNDTFERCTGWTRDEVIGRTPLEIKFWVDTNQRSTFIDQLRAQGCVRSMEILFRRKDGHVRTGLVSSELVDLNGESCALSLISDVTEAKEAERARDASEERLRLAQQAAGVGSFEWNIETGVNTWTPELESMYGLPPGRFGGMQTAFENLVHPDDRAEVVKLSESSVKTGQPTQGQWRVVWPDGSIHWIAGRWQVFMNRSGEPSRMIGVNIDVTERKMTENALSKLSSRLIEAHEEERSRIAREIHDDYNQRLAMMAIDLERLAEEVDGSSVKAAQQLHELYNRTSELGADLHSLSHSLHSSTLENLGLVAGVRAFCQEFAEQQGVQVDFAHQNVPRGIPADATLCMFRIAQEALRNVKRHSGADRAEVLLEWSCERLHLSVCDKGKGFDLSQSAPDRGIGLRGMEERLRVLGGQFEIESLPMKGTRIDAWLPIKVASQRAS